MQNDVLRTIETVSEAIVYCPVCNGTQLDFEDTEFGVGWWITCQDCGYTWEEEL